jgi:hypothetical protein
MLRIEKLHVSIAQTGGASLFHRSAVSATPAGRGLGSFHTIPVIRMEQLSLNGIAHLYLELPQAVERNSLIKRVGPICWPIA